MVSEPASAAEDVVAGLAIDDGLLRVVVSTRRIIPPGGAAGGASLRVVDDAEADLAPGVVRNGRVSDGAALTRRVRELWEALELHDVDTTVGLQPIDAQVRAVRVASWPADGWPDEVHATLAAVTATYGEAPLFDALPLRRGSAHAARLSVCRPGDVEAVLTAVDRAGVRVAGVELSGLAIERSLRPVAGPYALVVERSTRGPATLVLLDHGLAVISWRVALDLPIGPLPLVVHPMDEHDAVALALGSIAPRAWLLEHRAAAAPAPLQRSTPVVPSQFAAALGLVLGAVGTPPPPAGLHRATSADVLAEVPDRSGDHDGGDAQRAGGRRWVVEPGAPTNGAAAGSAGSAAPRSRRRASPPQPIEPGLTGSSPEARIGRS